MKHAYQKNLAQPSQPHNTFGLSIPVVGLPIKPNMWPEYQSIFPIKEAKMHKQNFCGNLCSFSLL